MRPLEKSLRNLLEKTVKDARDVAEDAARAVLTQLGVGEALPFSHLTGSERKLRRRLRAHGRQLGDRRDPENETQEIDRLIEEVAYEHWHRMLFARFLAENNLLMYPDPDDPVPITLEECEDLAADEGAKNGWELAARFAAQMLPQIFRPDSSVFQLELPPEHQQKLERLLISLPTEVFTASDSLGWVYQFWQARKKDEVNASEVKIDARELPAVTQLFTEPYMVSFLLDNGLGAWWVAHRLTPEELKNASSEEELRQKAALPGVPLEYLRFVRRRNPSETIAGHQIFHSPIGKGARHQSLLPSPSGKGAGHQNLLPSPSGREAGHQGLLPSPSGRGAGGEGKKKKQPISNNILKNARKLRKNQTDAEQLLWSLLRNRQFANKKFRRQHPVGKYILDFYCHELKLAIELDGGQHNEGLVRQYDEVRTYYIEKQGIRVFRFWNNEVLQQTESVLETIWNALHPVSLTPTPLPGGEGLSWHPAAGTFDVWPEDLREFKLLDPCCGSGHFLVAALLMLVPMRMELEGLTAREAVDAVLRDNLHGLEIDQRCVELAAFALALTAWRYPDLPSPSGRGAGGEGPIGYRKLPELNLACSGLSVSVSREEWQKLANGDKNLRIALGLLHDEFQNAPVLGSLLDPAKSTAAKLVDWKDLAGTLETALKKERSDEEKEAGVVAHGMAKAASLLAGKYNWVITNVPYLARGKQSEKLRDFCATNYKEAKNDIATVFLDRCLELCILPSPSGKGAGHQSFLPSPSGRGAGGEGITGGTVSVVLPQNWLFLTSYRKFREKLLKNDTWHLIARLGPGAFETISGEVVKAILLTISQGNALTPNPSPRGRGEQALLPLGEDDQRADEGLICGLDVSAPRTAAEKAAQLITSEIKQVEQAKQLKNPDARVTLENINISALLKGHAVSVQGLATSDNPQFTAFFWEIVNTDDSWVGLRGTVNDTFHFEGCERLLLWENGHGRYFRHAMALKDAGRLGGWKSGTEARGKRGIIISQMRHLPVSNYCGEFYDHNACVVVPNDTNELSAMWCYLSDNTFNNEVRLIDQSLKPSNNTFLAVPFDLDRWQKVAEEKYPNGLPKPYTNDPTQWIFHGHPCGSVIWDEEKKWTAHGPLRTDSTVLQVAVARLLGYRWPAEFTLTPNPSPRGRGEQKDPFPFREGGRRPGEVEMKLADEQREWVNLSQALLPFADEDGIVCIPPVRGEQPADERLLSLLAAAYNQLPSPFGKGAVYQSLLPSPSGRGAGGEGWNSDILSELLASADHTGKTLETWLRDKFFAQHCKLFHHRPFIWHIWDGLRDGFAALVNYHKLDRKNLETLIYTYLGDWINRQKRDIENGIDGAEEKLAAAISLKKKLELILKGESPHDIFVRWKPIEKQPIGWEPDLNDGVRLNIRPFMTVGDVKKKGAGILRDKPNIHWKKDRGKDVKSAPWYHIGPQYGFPEGTRINEHHLTLEEKSRARAEAQYE